ncbi:unnamed protein product [Closterium sp. NIES-65]|nr:unnamed protein product [Closterium sp. NIES-65]
MTNPFRFLSTPTDEHTDGSPKKTEIGAVAEETVAGATVAGGDVAGGNVAASVTSADAATADAAAVAAPATPRVPSSADVQPVLPAQGTWRRAVQREVHLGILPLPSTPIFLSQELPPIEHLPSSLPSLPPSQEPVMCFDATTPVDLGEKEGEEGIGGLGQMREIGAMGGTGENGREQSGGESEEAIQETQVEAEEVGGRRGHVEQEEQQGELEQRTRPLVSANIHVSAEAGDKSRAGTATVLGGEANMEGVREGLCGPGGGEVTGAGEGAAVGSCGVATGAVGGCGAMPGAVGSGMLGAAFWIGSSGPWHEQRHVGRVDGAC